MFSITTIKKRTDFLRLNRAGKAIAPLLILRYGKNETGGVRVGYTVTTQCGNAVARNRIKRRLRALARELLPAYARPGHDYVFIARADAKPNAADADFTALRASMEDTLQRSARA